MPNLISIDTANATVAVMERHGLNDTIVSGYMFERKDNGYFVATPIGHGTTIYRDLGGNWQTEDGFDPWGKPAECAGWS